MFDKRLLPVYLLLLLPLLACNLTSGGGSPTAIPNNPTQNGQPTATSEVVFVTATSSQAQATATPAPTATSAAGSGSNGGVTGPPLFSGLSFSTSAGGSSQTTFPAGTEEVYLRWNYSNVPVGTTLRRVWYRDGNVVVTREEAWSTNWGATGRLTHIKLYDYDVGLTPGNYYVVVSLPSYNVSIDGNFTITSGPPSISNLTASTRAEGPSRSVFPYGTEEVFIRFDFANIPTGTVMQREWYRDGVAVTSRSEAWKAEWGSSGTLNHISLFDRTSGYGLEPGNYRVVVYLRDQPSVSVETTFQVEQNVGPQFSNLRFASNPAQSAQTTFPAGIKRVYAIWDYAFMPVGSQVRRLWQRDGATYVDRTEAWNFDKYGTSGTVTDVSIFDEISGLPSGTYTVTISVVGQPGVQVTGTFTIQP